MKSFRYASWNPDDISGCREGSVLIECWRPGYGVKNDNIRLRGIDPMIDPWPINMHITYTLWLFNIAMENGP